MKSMGLTSDSLGPIRDWVVQQTAAVQAVRARLKAEREEWEQTAGEVEDLELAQGLVQAVAQQIQEQMHNRIASVVGRALEAVFDEPYEFRIKFEQKRGHTEASLAFVRDGLEIDPMTASGGGVVDVAAFALRLACLLLHRPPLRRVIILDEPFKFVSAEYRGRLRLLLERLAEEMKVQIIMVTHIPELTTGKVIQIG